MTRANRDGRILRLLAGRTPMSVTEVTWARPLRISAYLAVAELPDDLVVSVRCIVRVDDQVVVCTNADGRTHAWPGGRREPGEGYVDTACREVWEETGWRLESSTVEVIGFLHLFNLGEPLEPYPHPDVVQVVTTAAATSRQADDWTDLEGYELHSDLMAIDDAVGAISVEEPMCIPYLLDLASRRR